MIDGHRSHDLPGAAQAQLSHTEHLQMDGSIWAVAGPKRALMRSVSLPNVASIGQ